MVRVRLAAVLCGALLMLDSERRALGSTPSSAPAGTQDLIFVSDDHAAVADGCDAVSVIDGRTGTSIAYGERMISPGRLAATSDGSLVMSVSNNSARTIYSLRRRSADSPSWITTWREFGGIVQGGPLAISPDDQILLLPVRNGVEKYNLAEFNRGWVGPSVGRYENMLAGDILFSADSEKAYLCSIDGQVHVVDVGSMRAVHDPIPFSRLNGASDRRVRNTNAALSPDGRYLVVNAGNRPELNVIDLELRTSQVVKVSGLQETWDLAFNYAGVNRGLLVVHGRSVVVVYEFKGMNRPALLVSAPVAPQQFTAWRDRQLESIQYARVASVAWSGGGDAVIAATGSKAEWRILEFSQSGGARLTRRIDFDSCTHPRGMALELDVLTLNDRWVPTPTPTSTPTATATASVTPTPRRHTPTAPRTQTATDTPTATPSPSPTPTAIATPTHAPVPLYLPLALRERCEREHKRPDVALVIDTSSSMAGQKIEDAKAAAAQFVDLMDLASGRDQVTVVRFDTTAEVVQQLTSDRASLVAAIEGLSSRQGTHIDAGLRGALNELQSPRRSPSNKQVIVLLTDGIQTGTPGAELAAAGEVRAAGIALYTIGLGADADVVALAAMAGAGGRYLFAPDSAALAEIYHQIAQDIVCPAPPKGWWGRR